MANAMVDFRKEIQKEGIQNVPVSTTAPSSAPLQVQSHQGTTNPPMRPRSLYTAHSYHAQTDDSNFQRYTEFSKYFETPPSDQWGGVTGSGTFSSSAAIWRQPRNPKPIATPYYATEEACVYTENWREHETDTGAGGAIATPHGIISLRLHNRIRVDMTIDRAVRVINFKAGIAIENEDKKLPGNFEW
ncbi:uncharacterized protein LOC124181149 isoform X1 [Neodiprion fabricii]|uniref:uncharacterized protein LOC124181149 isoform X1 n=1 Tax=Neodiprion fabricii TaxID=2872261 RepID=UPI001ED93603|nr:uncharacterized protein LOC124181149 isoform X1 [Neodiprion fabricii]